MPTGNPGVKRTPEHAAKIAAALRGKPKSLKHRQALSKPKTAAHRKSLSLSNLTAETQARRKATMKANHGVEYAAQIPKNNRFRVEYWLNKGLTEAEARSKVSKIQAENSSKRVNITSHWSVSYWLNKGFTEAEAQSKISKIQAENSKLSAMSYSREGTGFLDRVQQVLGLTIEREVLLLDRFKVDGFEPTLGLVFEYLGSFWHMHPLDFKPEDKHPVTGWRASSKWAEDAGRISCLRAAGYKVFEVWDRDATSETIQTIKQEIFS